MSVGYKAFNTLNITLTGSVPYIQADVLSCKQPAHIFHGHSTKHYRLSRMVGQTVRGTRKLILKSQEALGFNLWENGSMTSVATTGANINYIFVRKTELGNNFLCLQNGQACVEIP